MKCIIASKPSNTLLNTMNQLTVQTSQHTLDQKFLTGEYGTNNSARNIYDIIF